MSVYSPTTCGEQTLYAALELSKNSWLLAIQLPDRENPSLHPIKGGDGHWPSNVGFRGKSRRSGVPHGMSVRSQRQISPNGLYRSDLDA